MPWQSPASYLVPAAFSKTKKLGRREYLRARLDGAGRVEVYKSEGSGRISGMAWANGLVELGDDDTAISAGDLVRFIPYESLGLPV
jgi:molybdopterin molybdotransferase